MRTKQLIRPLIAAAGFVAWGYTQGQATVHGHAGVFGDHLGWNSATGLPLEVRHDGNYPIKWYTDSIQRMQLYPFNNATLNTFNVPRAGFVGISPIEPFFNNPGPFSRLHLVDSGATPIVYAQDFGYRPWMRNGVTMTGNADQMYMGQKYSYRDSMDYQSGEVSDRSDAVIEWSDNPDDSPYETDRFRLMFTNDYQVSSPNPMVHAAWKAWRRCECTSPQTPQRMWASATFTGRA